MHKPTVIFDFDGTLVDSSPGIMHAIRMLADRNGYPEPATHDIEPVISMGSVAMLKAMTGLEADDAKIAPLQKDFFCPLRALWLI